VVKPKKHNVGPNHFYTLELGENGGSIDDELYDFHLF
jgi:hypothetical protein